MVAMNDLHAKIVFETEELKKIVDKKSAEMLQQIKDSEIHEIVESVDNLTRAVMSFDTRLQALETKIIDDQ